VAAITVEFV